jgi:hypothetical protein
MPTAPGQDAGVPAQALSLQGFENADNSKNMQQVSDFSTLRGQDAGVPAQTLSPQEVQSSTTFGLM